jgi:hypothetical protein
MKDQVLPIEIPLEAVKAFCLRHHIRRAALFGSVLRDDFTPESDIDVLIEFDTAHTPGLIGLGIMQDELASILGRRVDLLTFNSLHPVIRERVLREAQTLYVAA